MELGDYDAQAASQLTELLSFWIWSMTLLSVQPVLQSVRLFLRNSVWPLTNARRPKLSEVFESSETNVYVVGDCRRGPSTVVAAMGDSHAPWQRNPQT